MVQQARPGPVGVLRARPEQPHLAWLLAGGGADDPDVGQAVERDVAAGPPDHVRLGLDGDDLAVRPTSRASRTVCTPTLAPTSMHRSPGLTRQANSSAKCLS